MEKINVRYLRQSLDKTGDELAVKRQREDCQQVERQRGLEVSREFQDNDTSASGRVKRKHFEAMLALIAKGEVATVVAWSFDRLTRNRRDTLRLIELCQEHEVLIVLVKGTDLDMSTPFGRMMADQMAGWAAFEIAQKGDRHRRANRQSAEAGKAHISRRAYGYEGTTALTVVEDEAKVLREMARRFSQLHHSYKDIAYWLNGDGIKTSEGKAWLPITVRNTLARPLYAGIRTHNGVSYKGAWEPIFAPDVHESILMVARLRREVAGNVPKARKYLLTGYVFCGRCGRPMNGETKRDHPGRPLRRTYVCRLHGATERRGGCGLTRNAPALEDWILECLSYRFDTEDLGKLLKDDVDDTHLRGLLDRMAGLRLRINEIVDDYAATLLSREQMTRAKSKAEGELAKLQAEVDELNRRRASSGLIPVGKTIKQAWEECGSDDWRRQFMGLVVERIVVNSGNTKPFYKDLGRFDPTLIEIEWRA